MTEALAAHPKTFNSLYLNMVKAGEASGSLEITLKRLAEFMEKAQKIRNKIKAAMFYPCAVLVIALAILAVLMVFVVPRFEQVFDGLLDGRAMPRFTRIVLAASQSAKSGWSLGPWPQMPTYLPVARQAAMAREIMALTAGSRSSKSSAS